jgi:hypothetical protein
MDGLSDATFRWITRKMGSAYSVSEFVNTLDYANQKVTRKNASFSGNLNVPFLFNCWIMMLYAWQNVPHGSKQNFSLI